MCKVTIGQYAKLGLALVRAGYKLVRTSKFETTNTDEYWVLYAKGSCLDEANPLVAELVNKDTYDEVCKKVVYYTLLSDFDSTRPGWFSYCRVQMGSKYLTKAGEIFVVYDASVYGTGVVEIIFDIYNKQDGLVGRSLLKLEEFKALVERGTK